MDLLLDLLNCGLRVHRERRVPRPTSVNCGGNGEKVAIPVNNSIIIQPQIGTLQK